MRASPGSARGAAVGVLSARARLPEGAAGALLEQQMHVRGVLEGVVEVADVQRAAHAVVAVHLPAYLGEVVVRGAGVQALEHLRDGFERVLLAVDAVGGRPHDAVLAAAEYLAQGAFVEQISSVAEVPGSLVLERVAESEIISDKARCVFI